MKWRSRAPPGLLLLDDLLLPEDLLPPELLPDEALPRLLLERLPPDDDLLDEDELRDAIALLLLDLACAACAPCAATGRI